MKKYLVVIIFFHQLVFAGQALFYQPQEADFNKNFWDKTHFEFMKKKNIDRLIIQWSAYGTEDFIKKHPQWLKQVFFYANQYNIDIYFGLYADPEYFQKIQNPKINIDFYFSWLYMKNLAVVKEIYPLVTNRIHFKGWYLYDEINDVTWRNQNRYQALKRYLQKFDSTLPRNRKKEKILLSLYFTNTTSPSRYTELINEVIPPSWHLLIQTGIGAKLVDTTICKRYFLYFTHNLDNSWEPVIELFSIQNKDKIIPDKETYSLQSSCIKTPHTLFSWRYFFSETFGFYKK